MTPESDAASSERVAPRGAGARAATLAAAVLLLLAAALRAPHLSGPIDDPHGWRQAETAAFARAYYEDGIDLLRPSVVWLGPHRTLALEFPLLEALIALVYHATGGENLAAARLMSLASYLGAAVYLFAVLRRVFDGRVALLALATFCALPLGQFYSRAVHVDPLALCAGAGWMYHALRGYDDQSLRHALAAGVWAVPGALIKPPYLGMLAPPVGVWMALRFDARRAATLVACGAPALLALVAWRLQVAKLAAAVPDYGFIPGFAEHFDKHLQGSAAWYYGSLALREDPGSWADLGSNMLKGLSGPSGALLFALGLACAPLARRAYGTRALLFLAGWLAGGALYVLTFFNLNLRHDYYQLPLLAPLAATCAVGLECARRELSRVSAALGWLAVTGAVLVLVVQSTRIARRSYYALDTLRIEAGDLANRNTPQDAILIAGVSESEAQNDDPRLLYLAHRDGWAVAPAALDEDIAAQLSALGATHVFALLDGATPPGLARIAARHPADEVALAAQPWRALIVDLRSSTGAAMPTSNDDGGPTPEAP